LACGELEAVVERLRERFKVFGAVLFGSRARGDYKPWSDYDVLVVGAFDKPYLERLKEVLDAVGDAPILVELHPYTLEEAVDMLMRGNPIIVNALSEGVVLHKTKEFEVLEGAYRKLVERGLRRTSVTVVLPRPGNGA
jgi:predicted nucleotidyltransferase